MVLLDVGINRFRDIHASDLQDGIAGTSGTAVAFTDTTLVSPDNDTIDVVSTTVSNKSLAITTQIGSAVGNGKTFKEWGLRGDSGNTYYTRTLTAGVAKTSGIEITRITIFYYDRA